MATQRPKKAIIAVPIAATVVAAVLLFLASAPGGPPSGAADQPEASVVAQQPAAAPATAREKPQPNPGPAAPGPPAQDEPIAADSAAPADDEPSLMARIRAPGAEPAEVLALVRAGNDRYRDSPLVEERAQRAIDALVALGSIGEAHREAEQFIERWPTGERAEHVMNLMGVHPRPKRGEAR
jgi:hypothetical protein